MKNILEMLERAAQTRPDKKAFCDENTSLSFCELERTAQSVGTSLLRGGVKNEPVLLLLGRGVHCVAAMLGSVYAGGFYTVLDSEMPAERMEKIASTLDANVIIYEQKYRETAKKIMPGAKLFCYEEIVTAEPCKDILRKVREKATDSDPVYVLFTSGSTGVPKGAVLTHSNVLNYIEWFSKEFDITESTVFGSQTPLYFSMSVSDVFATLYSSATLHLIPKLLFSFPIKLFEFVNERQVNTIYWVPSALMIISNWKMFDYSRWDTLEKVLFAGEVMPTKQLNYWIDAKPEVMYANLFGPTETTDICAFYKINRPLSDTESIPIGTHCDNCGVMIVKEDGTEAARGEEGEMFVRGAFVARGYYNNPEKTAQAFVQNPLSSAFPETVYKTGDLVRENERGELIYICRRDFQIKHMGYRIEIGEIEACASALDAVQSCCTIYDAVQDKLVLIYQGKKTDSGDMINVLRRSLPAYMLPSQIVRVRTMPHNQNGKIDRAFLKNNYDKL